MRMTSSTGEARTVGRDSEFVEARTAEREAALVQNRRAAHVVAGNAVDATDCRDLLLMLGLTPHADPGDRG
jgi:hypothetical protein